MGCNSSALLAAMMVAAAAPVAAQEDPPAPGSHPLAPRRGAAAALVHPGVAPAAWPLTGGSAMPPLPATEWRRGATIGAVVGGVVGLGVGGFIALFCEAEGDGCPGAIPLLGLGGAAGGALLGGVLGAAVPSRGGPPETASARRDPTGSLALSAGWARADLATDAGPYHEGTGPAYRAALLAEVLPWLAVGPEVGLATFGTGGGDVRHAAGVAQLRWNLERIHPYVSAHLGAYQTTGPSLEFLGGGAAAGLRAFPLAASGLFLEVEARTARNLQNIAPFRLHGVSAAVGTTW